MDCDQLWLFLRPIRVLFGIATWLSFFLKKNLNIIFASNYFFVFLNSFDMLMSKINFKKLDKNIFLLYLQVKNILKSNCYNNVKHYLGYEEDNRQ